MTQMAQDTDLELRRLVSEELSWTPSIDSRRIHVEVSDGVVTLSGQVASFPEVLLAAKAARRLHGVTSVMEDITVAAALIGDADIVLQAGDAVRRAVDVPDQVRVVVDQGVITLSGEVQWQHEREAAARAVRYLKGVTSIHNLIVVRPTSRAVDLDARIGAALERSAQLKDKNICVTTDRRGHVTLTGSVSSWADRNQAEHACWAAPGITAVSNQLHVIS